MKDRERQSDTEREDGAGEDETVLASKGGGDGVGQERTEEGAGGEDRDDEGLLGGGDAVSAVGAYTWRAECIEPVGHGLDGGDGSGVVAIEDTTKRGESRLSEL